MSIKTTSKRLPQIVNGIWCGQCNDRTPLKYINTEGCDLDGYAVDNYECIKCGKERVHTFKERYLKGGDKRDE